MMKLGLPIGRMRNHLCPCGSGRKFKRCCMGRALAKAGTRNVRVCLPGMEHKNYHAQGRVR